MRRVTAAKAKTAKKIFVRQTKKQPEDIISRFAREGKFASIGKKAMDDSFKLGLSITRLQGNEIVEIFPDGHRRVLKTLSDSSAFKAL